MNLIFYLFAALIVLAPLPFGMVYTLHQAVFACLALALAAACTIVGLIRAQAPAVGLGRLWPETAGFFLVLAWGAAQIASWTPRNWHHPIWAEAGAALDQALDGCISLAPGAGFASLMRLAAYAAVFYLALQLGRDRHRARRLLWTVALAAAGYGIYGLVSHWGRFESILWVEREGAWRNVSGTFVNRNNFATFLGFGLLAAAGLYLQEVVRALGTGRRGRDRLHHLWQRLFVAGAPLLALVLVLGTALFLTRSRAGVACALAALLVLVVFLGVLARTAGPLWRLLTVALLAALLWVFLTSGGGWLGRLMATDLERETRLQVYAQTWQAIRQAPWTGYGIGAYEQAFLLFADTRTANSYKAHNDWLEMIFELGLPAAAVWFAVLGALCGRCLLGVWRRRRDHVYAAVGFCAALLAALHALVDFSLQIPAVAATLAVLLGLGVAQGWSSEE